MTSKKIKDKVQGSKAQVEKAHAEPSFSCHAYDFEDARLNEATAAKIAAAYPEITFDVDVSSAGSVKMHLDETKFGFPPAIPEFEALTFNENPTGAAFMAVWQDVQQVADYLVHLLFAETHADGEWLESSNGKQVAVSFIFVQLALYRFRARFEELKNYSGNEEVSFTETAV